MKLPNKAIALIGLMALGAVATVSYAVHNSNALYSYPFWALLLLTLATARMKVTLPGLTGNMAVSLPFLLIATTQLSTFEALLVALPACALQCFPKEGGRPKAVQVLFNLSTMAVAVAAAALIGSRFAGWGVAGFFLAQTFAVASIIQATEGGPIHHIWSKIAHYSFPFYVLSAGVCMMVTSTMPQIGWQVPLLGLPVLYLTYRSYESYFRMSTVGASAVARG